MAIGAALAAGNRILQVVVEEFVSAPTGSGFPGGGWEPLTTLAMSRREAAGDERFAAEQTTAAVRTVWTSRYHPELDPDLIDVPAMRRLVYRGRAYDIARADLTERRRGVELSTLTSSKL